jgi:DNA ligase (NAD+)
MTKPSLPNPESEVAELAAAIARHDHAYWETGEPEISDDAYDALVRRLRDLAPDHPLLHRVNAPQVVGSGKVRHARPMLSLDKAYSLAELLTWARKHARGDDEPLLVQPKYDGISANFANGVLVSRGDGEYGEDISAKLPLIELEATGYRGPLDRPARGEIVIREDDFRERWPNILKKDGAPYKNSRNAVAGIMGLKDIGEMRRQGAKLTLVDYRLVSHPLPWREFEERWPGLVADIEKLPYPLDGIVVKFADDAFRESLGATAHHPRGEIAFKFSGIRRQTLLRDVIWSFGKNSLTPVAQFEPVDIGGITIRQATLHNLQNVLDRDIQVGDRITVERAGDVIPYIVESEPGEKRRPCVIRRCPCCDTTLVQEGPELRCPNPECPETRLQNLLASVRAIGIERLGEPTLRKMTETLGVKDLRDLFALSVADLLRLEGFKDKAAANLHREIQAARRVPDHQLLAALNIPGIGKNISRNLLRENSLDELCAMDEAQLAALSGIGPERAAALHRELRTQAAELARLRGVLEVVPTRNGNRDDTSRPTVCFTGKMPEPRSHYEDLAQARGCEPVDQVTAKLSLLVAADPAAKGGKLDKAASLKVPVIALQEWLAQPHSPAPHSAPAAAPAPHGSFLPGFE